MFVPLAALVSTAALGLLLGWFLSETYRIDIWLNLVAAALPLIAALVLMVRPTRARLWVWLAGAVWVNIGLAFPFLTLLFIGDEPPKVGLGQLAALSFAAGSTGIIGWVTGDRHLRRIGAIR